MCICIMYAHLHVVNCVLMDGEKSRVKAMQGMVSLLHNGRDDGGLTSNNNTHSSHAHRQQQQQQWQQR